MAEAGTATLLVATAVLAPLMDDDGLVGDEVCAHPTMKTAPVSETTRNEASKRLVGHWLFSYLKSGNGSAELELRSRLGTFQVLAGCGSRRRMGSGHDEPSAQSRNSGSMPCHACGLTTGAAAARQRPPVLARLRRVPQR